MGVVPGAAVRPRVTARALVVPAVLAALTLSGCADRGRVVDAGPTLGISMPPVPERLWMVTPRPGEGTISATSNVEPELRLALPGITVPAGADAGALNAREVITKDPQAGALLKDAARTCVGGCELRPPVLRDVTGDKRRELIAFVDAPIRPDEPDEPGEQPPPAAALCVYQVENGQVFRILFVYVFQPGRIDLVGSDLVVSEPGYSQHSCGTAQLSSRYRWYAEVRALFLVSQTLGPQTGSGPCPKGRSKDTPS